MWNIIKSEKLKMKGSNKIIVSLPIITLLFSLIFGGIGRIASFSIFWWESLFCGLLILSLIFFDYKREETAGEGINIKINKTMSFKIFIAKTINIIFYLLISAMLFSLFIYGIALISIRIHSIPRLLIGNALIIMNTSFIVPIYLYLSDYINIWILMIVNTLIYLFVLPLVAMTKFYYLIPFSYNFKIGEWIFNISPKGEEMNVVLSQNYLGIGILTGISILLLFVLTFFLGNKYKRKQR